MMSILLYRGSIRVVIIGDHAEFLSNFLCSNWTRRPILALQLVRVKIEQGYSIFSTSTTDLIVFIINWVLNLYH